MLICGSASGSAKNNSCSFKLSSQWRGQSLSAEITKCVLHHSCDEMPTRKRSVKMDVIIGHSSSLQNYSNSNQFDMVNSTQNLKDSVLKEGFTVSENMIKRFVRRHKKSNKEIYDMLDEQIETKTDTTTFNIYDALDEDFTTITVTDND